MNDWNVPKTGKVSPALIAIGLGVIVFGGILLAGGLGLIHSASVIREIWPIVFILIGIVLLFRKPRNWIHLVWIAVPVLVYARQQRWIDFNVWAVLPPVLMLIAGGAILYRAFVGTAPREMSIQESSDFVRTSAILSGTELRPTTQAFTGGEIHSVMGGVKIDLTAVDLQPQGAVLDIFLVLGGMELHLPSNWIVKFDTQTVLGGLVDSRRPTTDEKTKTLVLRGFVLLGGVEIKN